MDIAVLGTGIVGQTIAAKLLELGHAVTIGTRDPVASRGRTEPGAMGQPGIGTWLEGHEAAAIATFADAAAAGELVFLATSGSATVAALDAAGADNLDGKVVIDISNPLDFSGGFPPRLSVCNDDSIGERAQAAQPGARIVKALNTVNASLMVDPHSLAGGDHTMFLCGNDADAKAQVTEVLTAWLGWRDVLDLGDITMARGMEMYLPLWVRMMGALDTASFNVKVVRAPA